VRLVLTPRAWLTSFDEFCHEQCTSNGSIVGRAPVAEPSNNRSSAPSRARAIQISDRVKGEIGIKGGGMEPSPFIAQDPLRTLVLPSVWLRTRQ
jgi:hypothetical protein